MQIKIQFHIIQTRSNIKRSILIFLTKSKKNKKTKS